jgi:hypothetical protein
MFTQSRYRRQEVKVLCDKILMTPLRLIQHAALPWLPALSKNHQPSICLSPTKRAAEVDSLDLEIQAGALFQQMTTVHR